MRLKSTSALLWAAIPSLAMASASPEPSGALKTQIGVGCYSSSDPLEDQGPYTYQSTGWCQDTCVNKLNKPVMGLSQGTNCWCGSKLPANSTKVDDSKCSSPCAGYDKDKCGGNDYWSVFLTGTQANVDSIDSSSSSSASPSGSKSAGPSVVTLEGSTVVVTASGSSSSHKGGGSKAGIAAGVVVGIIAVGAIIGGAWFYLRARKRKALEEEYRRNAAINSFIAKPGSTSSISDSRLEPSVMMQRRMSDGSIADNQDYSRRILKVTNPDGS
ncbi:MAG: hypothetical protein M1813_006250 [Trichoglossum hirsutum]|nr:MAG: hypothetical protein M1813_006250 [Trichoglossum hirsutum]